MLTFEQFLQNAADEGRSVNGLWEEQLFDVLGITEKITVPLTTQGIPHEIIGGLAVLIHVEASGSADGVMTADSDVLIRRCDLPSVIEIAKQNGFTGSGDLGPRTISTLFLAKNPTPPPGATRPRSRRSPVSSERRVCAGTCQTLRQQLPQCFDKFWVEESFNADDALVAYVNQHETGISDPATYATVTCLSISISPA